MAELLDVKAKARRVSVEDGIGFGIEVVLEGVVLDDIVKSINTALVAGGSPQRVETVEK